MKHTALWQGLVLAAGCIGCAFVSLPCAGILLAAGSVMLLLGILSEKRRRAELLKLCDEIDRILQGDDSLRFSQYGEGALGILTAEIGKMTVRLREQNAALRSDRQFMKESLEDVSHQLRTPLTTSMLLVGMLRKPDLSREERNAHVQELFSMLSRMQWMLGTMLQLSRLEAGAVQFQTEEMPLAALVRSALEPLEISMELAGVSVKTYVPSECRILADRTYFTEAVTNLLKNCLEHTPAGGTITIRGEENAIYTGLTITDSGPGIAEEELPHLFERFYRGSARTGNGFGIGLAFAQKMIAAQNGSLQVRNVLPHGAAFEIRMYRGGTV